MAAISVQNSGLYPKLSLFTNDGAGHLTSQPSIALTTGASFIVSADVNNDGYVDLLTANGNTEEGRTISVLLNQKNGKFSLQPPLDISALAFTVADLNGDGFPDLLFCPSNDLDVYFGVGNGTFGQPFSYPLAGPPSGLPISVDFDGNGQPDVVVPTSNSISFLRNIGKGVLELQDFAVTTGAPTQIVTADLNDDGKLDILSNAGPLQPTPTAFWLYTNKTTQVCGFSVTPSNLLLPTGAATVEQLNVKASSKCKWQAVSHSPWISVLSGSTGTGSGTVTIGIAANSGKSGRVAMLSVAGETITVTQP